MSNIYSPPTNLNQMIFDARTFLAHLSPQAWLIALVVIACGIYLFNREKTALIIALAGALYLLPFLISGHVPLSGPNHFACPCAAR